MSGESVRSLAFLLLGEQSLLVRCAERLLERGHSIAGVVAEDLRVRDWARDHGLVCSGRYEELQAAPASGDFDYLLSITNLRILPEWLLRLPRQGSINFHDGPLPRYAGLNAPVWALLNDEPGHGVVWHELTPGVDRGRILASAQFPLAADETAFRLNAKCYEAGYGSFTELLAQLEAGALQPTDQDLSQRSYFGLSMRPSRAACLDWAKPAGDLERLVRALDFGPYPNPLLLPKLELGGSLLLVREAVALDASPAQGKPGQLLRTPAGELAVQCAEGALVLRRLTDLGGRRLDPGAALHEAGFPVGQVLPVVDASPGIEALVQRVVPHEAWWLRQLSGSELTPAPFARRAASPNGELIRRDVLVKDLGPGGVVALVGLLLARLANRRDVAIALASQASCLIDPLLKRFLAPRSILVARFDAGEKFSSWRSELSTQLHRCEQRVGWLSDLPARQPDKATALASVESAPVLLLRMADLEAAEPWLATAGMAHVLVVAVADDGACRLFAQRSALEAGALERLSGQLAAMAARVADGEVACGRVSVLDDSDMRQLALWAGKIDSPEVPLPRIHEQFEAQVAGDPARQACVFEGTFASYGELNVAANRIARYLQSRGAAVGDRIGIRVPRSIGMVAAMIGVLKAGAAYVPLDPTWPEERLRQMAEDAGLRCVLDEENVRTAMQTAESGGDLQLAGDPADMAYLIYTSGSTGRPKGVMVEHRQVTNFFAGMDARFGTKPGTWLAVTSISFDISVLELLWTLARGFTVLLHGDALRLKGSAPAARVGSTRPEFGLFYWNVARSEADYDADKYRLLLESARFADAHGFNAVWTPERHFEAFGGLFPNPSVTSAALATITKNVQLRAGSCVVPLHSPIRIAEEWAIVDNLSNGRVGISVASGWAMPDFAIRPEAFANAKQVMFESTETLRRLWRGETVAFPGPKGEVKVRTLPRPIQKELPIWVTTAGNPETWVEAGRIGANVLTHLLGQSVEDVAGKVAMYRKSWDDAGHPGRGLVTLMLHTLVGPDKSAIEDTVRGPMKDYLRSAVALVKAAAWQFPTFRRLSEEQGRTLDEFFSSASPHEMDELLEFAFVRYFHESGLFGTPQTCLDMVERVTGAGIDEIACLIDFGVATDTVLKHLPYLDELRQLAQRGEADSNGHSLAALLEREAVTHLQCTPTLATMLAADEDARAGLSRLKELFVGGEALTPDLARSLKAIVRGRVSNMYGPTETTVWSAAGVVDDEAVTPSNGISIGTPLQNQSVHILDSMQQPLPPGLVGEIVIGGAGVTRGYWNQPDLTAERFIGAPHLYRTGDLGRFLPDGRIECLGRIDQQVKIRGHRVELGEIEAALRDQSGIRDAAVVLREATAGDVRLIAFVTTSHGGDVDEAGLRQVLGQILPDYMVPVSIHTLSALPVTPNGKVDRKALPAAPRRTAQRHSREPEPAPATDVEAAERLVAAIWRRALGVAEIDRRENFFDIGGHSLLVIQVLKELREQQSNPIQMTDLFRHTTIESLAAFLSSSRTQEAGAVRGRSRAEARRLAGQRRT